MKSQRHRKIRRKAARKDREDDSINTMNYKIIILAEEVNTAINQQLQEHSLKQPWVLSVNDFIFQPWQIKKDGQSSHLTNVRMVQLVYIAELTWGIGWSINVYTFQPGRNLNPDLSIGRTLPLPLAHHQTHLYCS